MIAASHFLLLFTLASSKNVIDDKTERNNVENGTVDSGSQTSLISEYKRKICDHLNTCSLVDQVPPSYRDLRTRDCMCDEKCTLFGDCCADSRFISVNLNATDNDDATDAAAAAFDCVRTAANGNVYMRSMCPASRNESADIVEMCETTDTLPSRSLDVWTFTPVTHRPSGIVYRNMFCALCNGVDHFEFWQVGVVCEPDGVAAQSPSPQQPALDALLAELRANETTASWQTVVANVTYGCTLRAKVAADEPYLRYCLPDVVNTCPANWTTPSKCSHYTSYTYAGERAYKNDECVRCNDVSQPMTCARPPVERLAFPYAVDVQDKRLPNRPRCQQQQPQDERVRKIVCPVETTTTSTTKATRKASASESAASCYRLENCYIGDFYVVNESLVFVDNQTILLTDHNYRYSSDEYQQLTPTIVFVCGSYIPRTDLQKLYDLLDDWLTETLIKVSILCLLLHLLVFQQLPEMRNLSGKNLAVFSATLLLAYLCFEMGPRLPRCHEVAVLQHYSLLSCFAWMLIMSYDCWLSLYRATKKFRAAGGKHTVRFVVYCALSCALPLAVVGVAVYFELAPPHVVPCKRKPAYGRYHQCFMGQVFGFVTFFVMPASAIFLCNLCFFAHTAYMIFLSQRSTVNPNTRNDFKLYTRLALMMGLTWTLGTVLFVTDSMIVGLLFSVLNMSQGIFLFFGFTFKQKTLKQLLSRHKNNPRIARFLSRFVHDTASESATATQQTQMDSLHQ